MALVIADRVKVTTTTTGTGDLSLAAASTGFQDFSAVGDGNTTYYAISSALGSEFEVGLGTYTASGPTLSRDTILASSNSGSAVDFSAGTKDVYVVAPADKSILKDASGNVNEDITGNAATATILETARTIAGQSFDGSANISIAPTDLTSVTASAAEINVLDGYSGSVTELNYAKSLYDTGVTNTEFDYLDGVTSSIQTQLDAMVEKAGDTMTGFLTLSADPTSALHAATKEYVDTIAAAGIHYHDPVRVESPSNLNATYDNGTAGVGATLTNAGANAAISIDGVSLSSADRVLVYNQTNAAHNGVYTVTTVGDGSTAWVLTRATDADSYGTSDPDALGEGDAFFVKEGDTGAGELYVMNTSGTITFGTTNITFSVIAETAVYSAGTDLTLDGTTFNLNSSIAANTSGNAATATALATSRTLQISGDATGSASFDGSANANISVSLAADSVAASEIAANAVGASELNVSGNGSTSQFLRSDGDGTFTWATPTDTNTTYSAGTAMDLSGTTFNLDLSELSTSTTNGDGDYFVVVDTSNAQRKLTKGNIAISGFNNDAGYTTNVGDITNVSAGSGLTGGGSSGSVTLNVGAGTGISVAADTVGLATAGAGAGTYGSTANGTKIDQITLDAYGRVTAVTTGATGSGNMTSFQLEDGDGTEVTISNGKEVKFVEAGGININWTDTSTGSDGDPYDLSFNVLYGTTSGTACQGNDSRLSNSRTCNNSFDNPATARSNLGLGSLATRSSVNASYIDANAVGASELNVSGNGTTSQFLRSDGDGTFTWATPTDTNTTYSAGSGLDLSGTTFSVETDLRDGITYVGLDTSDYIYFVNNSRIDFYVNGNNEFRMEADGDFHADGDVIAYSTTTASDERLKENIEVVADSLAKVESLRGVEFTWKRDGQASAGVIAQEVQEVLPQAVKQVTGMNGEDHLTVNYGALTSILIESIKELSAKVKELEAKVG